MRTNMVVVIDCQAAGISGDMFLGALLDLGADLRRVIDSIRGLSRYIENCGKIEVDIRDVKRGGFHAKKFDVRAEKKNLSVKGAELVKIVEQASIDLGLSEKARAYAVKVIKTLIYTEAKIHGENLKDVHLHEAGAIDTPAEIIGSAVALESLGLFDAKFYSTPVAVGGGTFKFSHGIVSSPAPATLEILSRKGVPIIGGPVKAELTTPTGASILASLVDEVSYYYPPMVPMKIGYGAGTREFREIPNLLRIVVGNQQSYGLLKDEVMIVETNLDDVTGEVIGYLIEKLLDEGVRDVSVIPIFTKKSRPAHIVRVITDRTDVERIARILMEETGSLGVRVFPCERRILSRKVINVEITVKDKRERVNVKVATDSKGKIIQVKPEYEDLKRISRITGIPLRRIREIAEEEAKKKLKI